MMSSYLSQEYSRCFWCWQFLEVRFQKLDQIGLGRSVTRMWETGMGEMWSYILFISTMLMSEIEFVWGEEKGGVEEGIGEVAWLGVGATRSWQISSQNVLWWCQQSHSNMTSSHSCGETQEPQGSREECYSKAGCLTRIVWLGMVWYRNGLIWQCFDIYLFTSCNWITIQR